MIAKNKTLNKILIIFLILFIVATLIISAIYLGVTNYFLNKFEEPELIVLQDECSLLMNNIIHQIKDEDGCKIMCLGECEVREKEFVNSEFILREENCHTCNCYCR